MQQPYEFLVRWNHLTGALQGAHVKTYDTVTMRDGDAQTVAIGAANGFPLSAVLTAIEQGAIVAMDDAIAAKSVAESARDTALSSVTAKDAEIAALTARIAALETPQQVVV